MKRILSAMLMLCVLLVCLMGTVEADTMADTSATSGIDVVIVLDMTASMDGSNNPDARTKNDEYNYRLDAAAMLISMLDMDSSRVAVVPFAWEPFEDQIIDLTSVPDSTSRNELVQQVYALKDYGTKPNTNIGAALMRANQILQQRDDVGNEPMIVLLTDGNNDMSGSKQTVTNSLRWDSTNQTIYSEGTQTYTTKTANTVTKEAVDCAYALQYPIYAIALNQDPDVAAAGGLSLRAISEGSGLRDGCRMVSKNDASSLPEYFADFLAARIGSSVQLSASPEKVEGMENTYEVTIPVLNQSVMEINIILPVRLANAKETSKWGKGIDASSIKMYDSNGNLLSNASDVQILRNDNAHFTMVKVRNPQPNGLWTLRFTSNTDPNNISFNILYNYNIKLQSSVESTTTRVDGLYKSDKLEITSWFINADGTKASDNNLYADHRGEAGFEDWMTIQGSWQLYQDMDGKRTLQREGTLLSDETLRCFRADVDLSETILQDGNYVLVVSAQGAGLNRSVEQNFVLLNHAPEAKDYDITLNVNSTDDTEDAAATWTVEGTSGVLPVKVQDLVKDADGDQLSYTLKALNNAGSIVTMEMDESTGTFTYRTTQDGDKLASGDAVYTLYYDDGCTNGAGSMNITFHVVSGVDEMQKAYTPVVTVNGMPGNTPDTWLKNTDLTLSVQLKDVNGGYADAEVLNRLSVRVDAVNTTADEKVSFTEDSQQDNSRDFTINTGNKAANIDVTVTIGLFDPIKLTVNIPNQEAPVAAASQAATIYCNGNGVPSFLKGLIGEETSQDAAELNVDIEAEKLFTDGDNDVLTYAAPTFILDESSVAAEASMITAEETGENAYHILVDSSSTSIFHDTFTVTMNIVATDGDGVTSAVPYTKTFTVVDLHNKFLTLAVIVGIALAALIVLILIIHQLRKPRFARLAISVTEEPSMYETSRQELPNTKAPVNAMKLGVSGENCGVSNAQLLNVLLKPARASKAIDVVCKKIEADYEITMGEKPLKAGQKVRWQMEGELRIRRMNEDSALVLKLCENQENNGMADFMDHAGGADDWTSDIHDFENTASKKSKRVSRSARKNTKQDTHENNPDDWNNAGGNDGYAF